MKRPHQIVVNKEWGRKHRKEEDRLRSLNNRDRRLAIEEQVATEAES